MDYPPHIPIGSMISMPAIPKMHNPAEWMQERIMKQIAEFEGGLNSDEEVGARMVSGGGGAPFHIEHVGYWGSDLLIFSGSSSDGRPVQLLQHITQVNVLLVALPKVHAEARRIGFGIPGAAPDE
jgi:hypothetical protein